MAGEDAVKTGGVRYLPRLESQTDDEYNAYRARASFFNATARTADGYVGLVCRRPPFIKLPEQSSAIGKALREFSNDADMRGTPLASYGQSIVSEIIAVGRVGTLVDWEADVENRVYVSRYAAENILNWRTDRINGRNLLTMVALREEVPSAKDQASRDDELRRETVEQIRVVKLVEASASERSNTPHPRSLSPRRGEGGSSGRPSPELRSQSAAPTGEGQRARRMECVVEIWRRKAKARKSEKTEWELVETRVPLRLGKPLPLIPFVFHGPRHSLADVAKLPLGDIIAVNLDHYRLDADYKHGMHFTALPTAWVSGFDKTSTLRIGSSTAWVTETPGATAGFLEYTGQGLTTFERAMDRDERLMAVLGARLLEGQKKVGEAAQAIELRQSGENSILSNLALSASASMTQVLRWAYWWNSTEELPDDVTNEQVVMELNTDFTMTGMSAQELTAVVTAWQKGAVSRDTMLHLFRRGEILPEGRTTEEEEKLIAREGRIAAAAATGESAVPML
jgi:hypothetical protein